MEELNSIIIEGVVRDVLPLQAITGFKIIHQEREYDCEMLGVLKEELSDKIDGKRIRIVGKLIHRCYGLRIKAEHIEIIG